jgi:hypothetical protein
VLSLASSALQKLGEAGAEPGWEAFSACIETLRGVAHALSGSEGGKAILSELRGVRHRFAGAFPLPAAAWLDWVRDEATFPAGEDALGVIERALQDCPASTQLRLLHLAYLQVWWNGSWCAYVFVLGP